MVTTTRRAFLAGTGAAWAVPAWPSLALANDTKANRANAGGANAGGAHGFSPLGTLKYAAGEPFAYVNKDAPKGGRLRVKTSRPFATINTLRYPGRPPAELRIIYDRLVVASDDEPASFYGVLAETVFVTEDFSEVRLNLHPNATWHDGRPVTPEDVAFTFNTLKAEGVPFYRQSFGPLTVVADGDDVVIQNARVGDRDLVRKIASIPIHPAHLWGEGTPDAPVGSGPYRLATFDPPGRMILERVPEYWGADLGPNQGRWNFDEIEFLTYRDDNSAFQAFTANTVDVHVESDPARWRTGYSGAWFSGGDVARQESEVAGVGELVGVVMNTKRAPFGDPRVRQAMGLAFDVERVATDLFAGSIDPFDSAFAGTGLKAGVDPTAEEVAILGEDFAKPLPNDAAPTRGSREALRLAAQLMDEAGLMVEGGVRRGLDGEPLRISLLVARLDTEQALGWYVSAVERLGVTIELVFGDRALLSRRMLDRDFDMATLSWSPARLPGSAERLLWHGALADQPGSYALSGIDDPALNRAIEALEQARSPAALRAAGRAFDRRFRALHLMVPFWRLAKVRLAWWDRFGRPDAEVAGLTPSPNDRWWAA